MVIATDYPFLDILWSMLIFFAFVAWIWILITILSDVFRRHDVGGWAKAAWCIFLIVLPFLGAFIYLIANHEGMVERNVKQAQAYQTQVDEHIKSVAGGDGAAAEIARAKGLLESGAITEDEYRAIKAKALS